MLFHHMFPLILNRLALSISSPEKAGVGGSSPSLATIFNNLQTTFFFRGCNWLHFEFICNDEGRFSPRFSLHKPLRLGIRRQSPDRIRLGFRLV